jgi:uncharacterized protein YcbK (DUF882 family)
MSTSAIPLIDRRRLLFQGLAAGCGLLLTTRTASAENAARWLKFYNIHTGESLRATYWESGHYLQDSLREIDFVLRDFRTGDVHSIDPELLADSDEAGRGFRFEAGHDSDLKPATVPI